MCMEEDACKQVVAERLSVRQLIVQRSHIASVCIYIRIYIRHTLIARGRGRLHRCGFCGPDSHVHVLRVRNAELRKKRSIRGKGTPPQKRVWQRRQIDEEAMYTRRFSGDK